MLEYSSVRSMPDPDGESNNNENGQAASCNQRIALQKIAGIVVCLLIFISGVNISRSYGESSDAYPADLSVRADSHGSNVTNNNHTKNYRNDNYTDNNDTKNNHTHSNYTDHNDYSKNSYTDNNYTNNNYTGNNDTKNDHTDNNDIDNNYTLTNYTNSITDTRTSYTNNEDTDTGMNFSVTKQYQNPLILREGCSVTVLLMDPNVGADSLWALESVAEYIRPVETTCFLIQTSTCMEIGRGKSSPGDNGANNVTRNRDHLAYARRAKRLEEEARPLFRHMIRQGNVRMTVLDDSFYKLKSCDNFYSPSTAWQNWNFWGPREFVDQDADLILTVQADAVLCRPLDIRLWQDVPWVGAPWPAQKGSQPWHQCSSMPSQWEGYHKAKQDQQHSNMTITIPPYPTPDQLCNDIMLGPQGNGGLSVRQRSWLRRAIEYCPTKEAGIDDSMRQAAPCDAYTTVAEDLYFVTILRGLGAPLPSAYDAALFSWESRSMSQIVEQYHVFNETWKDERMSRRWVPDQYDDYMKKMNHHVSSSTTNSSILASEDNNATSWFVPIGIHKPWSVFFVDKMCEPQIHRDCKYLRHIILNSKDGMLELEKRNASGNAEPCFETMD